MTSDSETTSRRVALLSGLATLLFCLIHTFGIWHALGGYPGLTNGWPLLRNDHPLYFHSALVTREFLKISGTTAGYDPSFMSGYPKSVIFPASSTLPELAIFFFGGEHPEFAYKLYVLLSASAMPFLFALAARLWGLRPQAVAVATLMAVLYVWGDFPINYVDFGMLPYFLTIPLALLTTVVITRYLEKPSLNRWALAAALSSFNFLVHLTSAMIIAPAVLFPYLLRATARENRLTKRTHLGFWLIPVVVLATNAFWWLPGFFLGSTKGASDFAFVHHEGVISRLMRLFSNKEAVILIQLLCFGLVGLSSMYSKSLIKFSAMIGFVLAGFFWGYLSARFQFLDFLQPGRHTYALYLGLSLAGGMGISEPLTLIHKANRRMHHFIVLTLILFGLRIYLPAWNVALLKKFDTETGMLAHVPSDRLKFVIDQVRKHTKKGDRILYEEGGFGPEPFKGGRYSGLIPWATDFNVELIGGPYLHASLTTNFTQFGEEMLYGRKPWGRDRFVAYGQLYRPTLIVCWSLQARAFCLSNPDVIRIVADDNMVLVGRVLGFEGEAINGEARVEASSGRLKVEPIKPGVDGSIILRYHSVPGLKSSAGGVSEILLEGDPVPFLRIMNPSGPTTLEWRL